jgi:hypothetical protein
MIPQVLYFFPAHAHCHSQCHSLHVEAMSYCTIPNSLCPSRARCEAIDIHGVSAAKEENL